MSTDAQIAANRLNSQLSTGPTSPTGKATSSLNAVKTGLTGRTVLLSSEDAAAYSAHVVRFEAQWQPATDPERSLVQALADTEWRLLRIPRSKPVSMPSAASNALACSPIRTSLSAPL